MFRIGGWTPPQYGGFQRGFDHLGHLGVPTRRAFTWALQDAKSKPPLFHRGGDCDCKWLVHNCFILRFHISMLAIMNKCCFCLVSVGHYVLRFGKQKQDNLTYEK